ncbi:MAG: glycosyltransferase [Actinomycetota bacterium]
MCGQSSLSWVILTRGDRRSELRVAATSVSEDGSADVVIVSNGGGPVQLPGTHHHIESASNVGIPAARHLGLERANTPLVGFLDDDAALLAPDAGPIVAAFDSDPTLAVVSLRIIDEQGETSRRHVPRLGEAHADRAGEVATFLGGACAIRREAYEQVGGYFTELFYGHEELELSWRLIDAGWRIRYLADVTVFHPRTEISRHADGWRLTGRNRVWIARRTLPWPVALVHVAAWLVLGTIRAPAGECRRSYLQGWMDGWRSAIEHRPIRWRTVWRLAQLGRPPVI